jgi:transposase
MRTSQELDRLREQAVMLRRQGKSLRQIKEILGPMSNVTLHDALKGEPPPEWTRRPKAKDELRARARELRTGGMSYAGIAAALGVAKSSVSYWVRDMPRPARLSYEECRKRSAEGAHRYWAAERPARAAQRAAAREAAAAEIGNLTARELLIAGAIAYWCEGSKTKPQRRIDRVVFINSDPSQTSTARSQAGRPRVWRGLSRQARWPTTCLQPGSLLIPPRDPGRYRRSAFAVISRDRLWSQSGVA